MPKQYLDSATIYIENSLLVLLLGVLIHEGLEQYGTTIEEADHPVEYTAPKVQKGHDVITIWCIMLQQIYGVSEAIAAAIVDHYPSVNSLLEAYEQNPQKAKDLLIRVPISGKKRNINRTISMHIHTFLTSDDPKTLINLPSHIAFTFQIVVDFQLDTGCAGRMHKEDHYY
ncbi:hypothetical protein BC936DRAFT_137391 [Jimgerdemannia flammicorona]|uniref:ERCC4 domain-containing protein n=1 Tax=Jimgerdemannia flammicorona TaxID=994334 RepID=A0A433CXI8_9FUNG|nr:hypothetical protein BC936DRAFT_137391 [Jimgerdemannia flammicorona]